MVPSLTVEAKSARTYPGVSGAELEERTFCCPHLCLLTIPPTHMQENSEAWAINSVSLVEAKGGPGQEGKVSLELFP